MVKIREAIVVEGRYDKNTLSQIVDTTIFQTNGFAVINDEAQLTLLRRAAEKTGLIVFTDSDGAGFVIRNFLKGAIPTHQLKHAYIPDILGKEHRKTAPGKEGKLGVEGMTSDVILNALKAAGATFADGAESAPENTLTKQDLFDLGLSGAADSKTKRLALLKHLQLPEHLSTNAMLQAINLLYNKDEMIAILQQLEK